METQSCLKNEIDLYTEENIAAENCIENEKLSEAARILVALVEKDPANWRAFNNIGIIAWVKCAWEDAYSMFRHSVELKPTYTDGLINLFDAALKLGRVKEATPYFTACLAANPDDHEMEVIVDTIQRNGEEIYQTERALRIGRYNPDMEEAQKLLEEGNYISALEKYLKLYENQGADAGIYTGLGIIAYHNKKYEDAYRLFFESIRLNPTDCDTYLNFLDAAKECGRQAEAKKVYQLARMDVAGLDSIAYHFDSITENT